VSPQATELELASEQALESPLDLVLVWLSVSASPLDLVLAWLSVSVSASALDLVLAWLSVSASALDLVSVWLSVSASALDLVSAWESESASAWRPLTVQCTTLRQQGCRTISELDAGSSEHEGLIAHDQS
jgi:hypothetical protein